MKKTIVLGLVAFGTLAFAANNSYRVHLAQDSVIEGKTVKAGDYRVSVENGNAVLKQGKESIEVPAHEVTAAEKTPTTEAFYKDNTTLQQIKVGGTHTTIVFGDAATQTVPGA